MELYLNYESDQLPVRFGTAIAKNAVVLIIEGRDHTGDLLVSYGNVVAVKLRSRPGSCFALPKGHPSVPRTVALHIKAFAGTDKIVTCDTKKLIVFLNGILSRPVS
jgi:hypothetical protein